MQIHQRVLEQHVEAMIKRLFTRYQIFARCHNGAIWIMRNEQPELLCLWTGRVIPRSEATKQRSSPLGQLGDLFLTSADSEMNFSKTLIFCKDGSMLSQQFTGIVRIKHLIGHLAIGFDRTGTTFLLNGRTGEMLRKC